MISDGLWRRVFGADPDVIGTRVRINDMPHSIIGVLPPQFALDDAELLRPRALDPNRSRSDHQLSVIGLLRSNVTLDRARAELAAIATQLAANYPADNEGWTVRLVTFDDWLLPRQVRDSLVVLQGAVLLVLLIACINVANLLFARGVARQKETAIRVAMGASRRRIIWHGLMESALLALAGAVTGVGLAAVAVRVLSVYAANVVPRVEEASIDWVVLSFALVCALVSAAAFGLLPSVQAAREHGQTLHETSRGTGGRGRERIRAGLTVVEVSLSVALLIGAGLLLRSFITLQQVDAGFDVDAVMTGRVLPASATDFDTRQERRQFWDRVTAEVAVLPGVTGVSTISFVPLGRGNTSTEIAVPGAPVLAGVQPSADWRVVAPGYFETMGIPIRGRDSRRLTGQTTRRSSSSVKCSRGNWPNEDQLAKRSSPVALAIAHALSSALPATFAAPGSIGRYGRWSITRTWRWAGPARCISSGGVPGIRNRTSRRFATRYDVSMRKLRSMTSGPPRSCSPTRFVRAA
jgi:putative ABC transport system permease protein